MEPSQQDVDMYINQLSEQERIALKIAQDLLKSSFSVKKSLGLSIGLKLYRNKCNYLRFVKLLIERIILCFVCLDFLLPPPDIPGGLIGNNPSFCCLKTNF